MGQQRGTRSWMRGLDVMGDVMRGVAQRRAAARRSRVGRLVLRAVGLGLGIAAVLIGIGWLLVRDPGWAYHTWPQLTPAERTTATTQFRTTVVQVAAAAGALVALAYTARTYRLTHRGQVTERFSKALERLGSPEPYVRLGGVHALEHVMADSPDHHRDVVEVLVAFIRQRTPRTPDLAQPEAAATSMQAQTWLASRLQDLPEEPAPDVQAALTVLGRRPWYRHRHEPEHLNLSGLHLSRVDLTGADLTGARLEGASLAGARLDRVNLTRARLPGANLTGARLYKANLTRARLPGANLTDAWLIRAKLTGAQLARAILTGIWLHRAKLTNAQLEGANLTRAKLSEANLTRARLAGANLTNAFLEGANLTRAQLNEGQLIMLPTGGRPGKAKLTRTRLDGANLTGARLNKANLTRARLDGVRGTPREWAGVRLRRATGVPTAWATHAAPGVGYVEPDETTAPTVPSQTAPTEAPSTPQPEERP